MTAMQQIEALCIEARKHGMTYGEYIDCDKCYHGKVCAHRHHNSERV